MWSGVIGILEAAILLTVGAWIGHSLSARRWRIETRKDSYIRFARAADALVDEIEFYGRSTVLLGNPKDYDTLHNRFKELRSAFHEVRIVAAPDVSAVATTLHSAAGWFVHEVQDRMAEAGGDRPGPLTSEEYQALLHREQHPTAEQVARFVEEARSDLTVDSRRRWWSW